MDHGEYIKIVPGSPVAVLMIHGIASSPAHFECIMPAVPEDCSVYNILLDGHGAGTEDFSKTCMKRWKAQVKAVLSDILPVYERIVIVAHSMGTLFAIQAAIDHPDKISGLFLLSVPTRPRVKFSTMLNAVKVALGRFGPEDEKACAMYNDTGIRLDRRLWKYIGWLPRFMELLAECRRVRGIIPELRTPVESYCCMDDELVSPRAFEDMQGHPFIENMRLFHSGHFSYGAQDAEFLRVRLGRMIGRAVNKEIR